MLSDTTRALLKEVLVGICSDNMFGDGMEQEYIMDGMGFPGLNNMSDEELIQELESSGYEGSILDRSLAEMAIEKMLKVKPGDDDMSKVRLEQWAVVSHGEVNPYTPPECISKALVGKVFGHPKFKDGDLVHTSALVELDLMSNFARTANTEYELGECDPKYAEYMLKLA